MSAATRKFVLGSFFLHVIALLGFSAPPSWAQQQPTSPQKRVWQTAWERRHPCLLASVSRSLPEIPQARMPALPGAPHSGRHCHSFSASQRGVKAPENFDQVAAKAEQARGAARIDEAIGLYRKALSLRPRWGEGWWYLGALLYERDAFADAAVALSKATALSPKVGTAWVMLGLCEFNLGRFNDALTHIRQGRKMGASADPQFKQVMVYHEGVLLIGKGEFEQAQETLGQLSRDGVENEDVTNALGLSVLRIRFSDLLAGDSTLRQLVRRAGLAEHLAAQKKFDGALGEYERLATDFPKAANVQHAFGRYLLLSDDAERAVVAFQRAIENDPAHLSAHLFLANTKLNLKDFASGLPYAEKAVKLNPRMPLGHFLLGSLLLETGQTARAIAELETAGRLLPNEPKIYFALARAYARANRKKDAAAARATFLRLNNQAVK